MPVEGDRPLAADMAAEVRRSKCSCWAGQGERSAEMEPVGLSRLAEQECSSLLFLESARWLGPFGRQASWFLNLYPSRAT